MTVDHIPDVDLEVSRIRSNGGVIRRPDYSNGDDYRPMRVYQQNSDMPGLKTTRFHFLRLDTAGYLTISLGITPVTLRSVGV
eukprot:2799785-Rhodomonas_salina.1